MKLSYAKVRESRSQDGINMVDLMMWLVIAALLLAAAIQGIGYYQKAAYLYQMQSDLEGAGTVAVGIAANEDGAVTKTVADKALIEAKRSALVDSSVEVAADGKTPYLRAVHPGVADKDVLYLFDACADTYKIGVNVVPKGGTPALEACGISATPPSGGSTGGGTGTPSADDIDGDGIPNASDPDIDGDGILNASDPTPNGDTPTGGTPTIGEAIGRTATLQIAGFGTNYSDDLADYSALYDYIQPNDNVLQGDLATQPIYAFSKNTGSSHQCAVGTTARDLYCWGTGSKGQLGVGTTNYSNPLPLKVAALSGKSISEVATGGNGTCAIADNTLYCWGDGWLTYGSQNNTPVQVGASVLANKKLTQLIVANQFGCLLADGNPYCWGTNTYGQFGNGDSGQLADGTRKGSVDPVPTNTAAFGGKAITSLGAFSEGVCATTSDSVYCWGHNNYGQIGDGSAVDSNVPVVVTALNGKNINSVSGSYTNTCGTSTTGVLYCWGGTWNAGSTPAPMFTDGDFAGKSVTSFGFGSDHTCVVASNQVYCWGDAEEWGGEYVYFDTPQLVDNGLFTGKKVLNVWSTSGANFVNYEK